MLPVELPACPWNWSQKILASFKFSCANFSEDSEVGRSQGTSAGRNASVLGPGRSVDLSCASAGQTLPGSKEETAICKNLDWNQRSAANVILCRCYTRYSLARPLEALCSRVPGSAETCLHGRSHRGNPRFMAQLAQSQRNLSTVSNTPAALSFKSFRSEFQLWVHVCPRDFAFSWRVGEADPTRQNFSGHGARWKPGKLSPGKTRAKALRRRGQRMLKVVFLRARAVGVCRPSRGTLAKWIGEQWYQHQ